MTETTFENKCHILADFYVEYKGAEQFADFYAYCDLGLPLAYSISAEIVKPNPVANTFVEETFALFLELLGISEDLGYEDLEELTAFLGQ
jgi:hypothetical protein